MTSEEKKKLQTTLFVWVAVILGIHLLVRFQNIHPFFAQIVGSLTAIALIYPPVLLSLPKKEKIDYWQINSDILKRDIKWFLIFSLAVFPAVFLGNHFYQNLFFGLNYNPATSDLWASYVLSQILVVAFPEEFFFRGYIQGEFNKIVPPAKKLFGVPFGRAQIYASLLFAISHSLITVQWWHIFIFFPSLAFAWLKEKTGTIWAATLFHAACNVFSYWVALHYR